MTDIEALARIVGQAARGDEAAFARIVAAHNDDMARVSYVVCGDVDVAQEAVAAAWAIAWRRLATIRDPERLRPWLMSVAANEARQLVRRQRRRTVTEITVDGGLERPGSVGTSAPGDWAAAVDLGNALRRLGPDDRSLIAMRYAVGLTSAEIGQAIGMSAPGVRAKLARLLDRLREDLGGG